jgi:hypothetical protein
MTQIKKHRVSFEFLGKKGSCTIKAGSPERAREILRARLIITEVHPLNNSIEDFFNGFGWSKRGEV